MLFTHRQLRAFVAVADAGSFSAAALHLHLSISAVSLLVRELETSIGFRLFERTTRRVALTGQGAEFLLAARRALGELQQLTIQAHDISHRVSSRVTIAAPPVLAATILAPLLAKLYATQPDVVVQPLDCSVEKLGELVLSGHADLALGPVHAFAKVEIEVLFGSPWVIWVGADHELATRQQLQWPELAKAGVVVATHDYDHYQALAIERISPEQQFTPNMVVENVTTALGMAAAGLGVALCPAYVEPMTRCWSLVKLPLTSPSIVRDIGIYHSTAINPSTTVRQVVAFLRSSLKTDRAAPVAARR